MYFYIFFPPLNCILVAHIWSIVLVVVMALELVGHGGGAGDHGLRDARGSQRGLGFGNSEKRGFFEAVVGGWIHWLRCLTFWVEMDTLPKFNSTSPWKMDAWKT